MEAIAGQRIGIFTSFRLDDWVTMGISAEAHLCISSCT